jgi:serine/threonine protein kinase
MQGIVRGLSRAHSLDIYHRDLKPANLLVAFDRDDACVKIADFGLAKVRPTGTEGAADASQAVVVGTNVYLPPEATEPFRQREPAQDDVFAVGVIWYQLVVERLQRPPYDFAEELREKGVDSRTIRVIERCLAKPGRRFGDASELEQAVDDGSLASGDWKVPPGCFDVGLLAREYLSTLGR